MVNRRFSLLVIVAMLVLPAVTALVSCDILPPDLTYEKGTSTAQQTTFRCSNPENLSTVALAKSGTGMDYFDLDSATISSPGVKTFTLDFDEDAPVGLYSGKIDFSDSSPTLSFILEVTGQEIDTTSCQINPSLVSYTQQVQQGTKIPMPKITFNPINCNSPLVLTASSVSIQGGVVTPGGQKPVFISSVESDGININIDTEGLNSQTYSSKLKISAYSKQFEIPFTIIVTGGTSGSGNFDINNLPKCSLTSATININETHSLVCTNLVPDVEIIPRIDSKYIRGIGKQVELNQFSWEFQGKKFGNTILYADFYYLGVPVGDPFERKIIIASSGGNSPGTDLKFVFTPALDVAQSGGTVAIQLVDNGTNSLVLNPEIEIDAIPLLNSSGRTFFYIFESDINYSMRGSAEGYNDLIESVRLQLQEIEITISPEIGNTNQDFTITTDVNATISIDGTNQGNEYVGRLSGGAHIIEAFKEGFFDKKINFTVENSVIFGTSGEFKKGTLQTITLSMNATWSVYYQKDVSDEREIYNDLTGVGDKIEFTPEKKGTYTIETDDGSNKIFVIDGFDWNQKWKWFPWYIWFIAPISIYYGIRWYTKSGGSSSSSKIGFGGGMPKSDYSGEVNY